MVTEVRLPEISENVDSGEVIDVLVKVGDIIKKEQSIIEIETEKATFEVPSTASGKVIEINVKEGQKVKVGEVLLKVETEAKATENKEQTPSEQKTATVKKPEQKPVQKVQAKKAAKVQEQVETTEEKPQPATIAVSASPSVRQLARELGIDIGEVTGSGPEGQITLDDIKEHAKRIISSGPMSSTSTQSRHLPDFTKWGEIERQPMTATRRAIADTLSYTWANVPQVTQYDEADITELEKFRAEYSKKVEQAGGRLTITSIAMKVVASALKVFPKFNASVDTETEEIIYKKYCHISVAVDTNRGLLVPTIRDVDKKSILQLSVELTELAQKARDKKISPEDMLGGNFTISNLGGIGGTNFAPIIYWPQVAILGLARARQKAVYINNILQPRMILPLSLSYDHRIIDGTEGLRFLRWIVETLERPFTLAMQETE
ncbi:MAG: branched-chain alpha-keto acid dehydrogenase subunit E2 [Planctomycetes bacterium RBG_13_46_10]|nr:MAG: branched-chain alpha-keto acid dehydrogenase subunit E2 [Planctomycetes bacterium RBG_13_46_10]